MTAKPSSLPPLRSDLFSSLSLSLSPPPLSLSLTLSHTHTHTHTQSRLLQDGASLSGAMVCENVLLRPGCVIEPGAIVSYRVVIGPNCRVTSNKRVSLCRQGEAMVRTPLLARGGCDAAPLAIRACFARRVGSGGFKRVVFV
jgi:hypothetical protein